MKKISFLAFSIILLSCSDQLVESYKTDLISKTGSVSLPAILGSKIPNSEYSASEMTYVQNRFIGVGKLSESTLNIVDDIQSISNNYWEEGYNNEIVGQFEIIIDTTQTLTIDEYDLPDNFYDNISFEDYFNGGIEKLLDQHPLIKYNSLPVFVINTGSRKNYITVEDGQIAMIYEAKNQNGNWYPIEFKTYSWCGNSYVDYKLNPNEYALLKVPVQSGDFKTKLRLKARLGDKIFYSNIIDGTINLNQFNFESANHDFVSFHYDFDSGDTASLFLDE